MKATGLKLKAWWLQLAVREKQAVAIGSAVVIVFIFYQLFWLPYLDHIAVLRKRIVTEQKTLAWMQAADVAMQKAVTTENHPIKAMSPIVFLSELQKRIEQAGLATELKELKQGSAGIIEMHFAKVEFDRLLALLIAVMKEQPVTVTQFSVTAEGMQGVVNASVMLKVG